MENTYAGQSPVNALELDTRGYPTGRDGTIWATYDSRQADIIRNALLHQHIACELKHTATQDRPLHLLCVTDARESAEAMDFIWREHTGLRLRPDWTYGDGEINASFEHWLGGT